MTARDNGLAIKGQHFTINSRLLDGRYPKWRDVFPDYTDAAKIKVTVGPLYSAVRQAAIFISDERRGVDFTFGDGKAALASHGAELGAARVELPVAYDGTESAVTLDLGLPATTSNG